MFPQIKIEKSKSSYPVFLIDDEPIVLDFYVSLLRDAGYRNLQSFSDAEEAIRMLRCLRPSLIITDIHMPNVDGNMLTRLVREFEHLESVTVIAITADADEATASTIMEQGADVVLFKPVTACELLGHVAKVRERDAIAESQSCR